MKHLRIHAERKRKLLEQAENENMVAIISSFGL